MSDQSSIAQDIRRIYRILFEHFGPQNWWPGDTDFEVIVGAVLTQNTNWGNVQKAISNLKRKGLLSIEGMRRSSVEDLAEAIKPAGYFNVKARRLKNVVSFIVDQHGGSLKGMRKIPMRELRRQWLMVNGVGPETADSILLYALGKPIFVVDAYTKRFLSRHNIVGSEGDYAGVQSVFMNALREDSAVFNEYHALIVKLGKDFCKTKPRCEDCPLKNIRYDVKNKCVTCHRSFLGDEKRHSKGKERNSPICRDCWALEK